MPNSQPARALELFAGYGGLALGAESLGARVVALAEIEPAPALILGQRFPGVPNLGDVRTANWDDIGPVDLISGGSPCQDISFSGLKKGMLTDSRSGLWGSMRDAVTARRPTWVIWENVRAATLARAASLSDPTGNSGTLRALGRVLGDLVSLGYDAEWRLVKASDIGAPHQRGRIFVLAWERETVAAAEPEGLPFAEWSAARDIWAGVEKFPTHGAIRSGQLYPRNPPKIKTRPGLLPTLRANDMNGHCKHGTGGPDLPTAVINSAGLGHWGKYSAAVELWADILGRPAPASTETGLADGPRLTARFAEWLMGVPEGWVTDVPGISRAAQIKALGNGVVPAQAEHALAAMLADIGITGLDVHALAA